MGCSGAGVLVVAHDPSARSRLVRALAEAGYAARGAAGGAEAKPLLVGTVAAVVVDPLVDMDTIDFIRRAVRQDAGLLIVAVLPRGDDGRVIAAIRAGAHSCLYVDEAAARFVFSVGETLDGGRPMSAGMGPLLLEHIRTSARRSSRARPAARPLSAREIVVLGHMARGLSYEETGGALGVTINTVRTYVRAIYDKLEVGSRTEAVLLGIKLGMIKATPGRGLPKA